MEAARCQLGNLLTFPRLRKWTMSPLIRYPPRGQMSALLTAFLSSSLPGLLTAPRRSGPITSPGSARGAAPLPALRPPARARCLPLLTSGVCKDFSLKGWKITGTGETRAELELVFLAQAAPARRRQL